jgi:hypothetical protein
MKLPEAAPAAEPEAKGAPRCRCGHGLNHLMVSQVPAYTAWQTFLVFFAGVSAAPERIDYQCRVCRDVFHTTTDASVLQDHH